MKKALRTLVTVSAVVLLSGPLFVRTASAEETNGSIAADTTVQIPTAYQIVITQNPLKTIYSCGESLDLTGLQVQSLNYDGSSSIITDYTYEGFDSSRVGIQTVMIKYQNCYVSLNVTVNPAKVKNVRVSNHNTTSYTLTWDAASDVTYYEIYARDDMTGMYTAVANSYNNSYTFSQPSGTVKTYQIRVVKDINGILYCGEFSDSCTAATSPDQVQTLTTANTTNASVDLSWSAVTGATGYSIYRKAEKAKDFVLCGNTQNTTYTDTGLAAGTVYEYKVSAYIYDDDFFGEASPLVTICTNPGTVKLTIKAGEEKARLTWTKVTGATSYDIYGSDGMGGYYLLTTTNSNTNSYVLEGLTTGETYSFYIIANRNYNGTVYSSAIPTAKSVTITEVAATSTKAKYFSNKKEFLNSDAYTKIDTFKSSVNYSKSYVIPGLIETNVGGFISNSMCPQGVCFAKDYLLVSAYDMKGEEMSVVYVMDKNSKKLLTTLVLPTTAHVGGICYDGKYVWLTTGSKASALKMTDVKKAVKAGKAYSNAEFFSVCKLGIAASYITYYDEKLWVGTYNELQNTYMYSYEIDDFGTSVALTKVDTVGMPTRVQGVSFTDDGYLILSRSCQLYQGLRGYMRRIEVYQPDLKNGEGKTISIGSAINCIYTPSMNEGIALKGSYLYVLFESGAFPDASYKMDRICAIKLNSVLGESIVMARSEKSKNKNN
jgi:fibronectin type 3 domain-containing protein